MIASTTVNEIQGLITAGQLEKADTLCTQLLQKKPDQPDVLHLHGIILIRNGALDSAIQAFSRAVKSKPSDALYNYNLGLAYLRAENFEEAVNYINTAIQLNPTINVAYNDLCLALYRLKKNEEAIEVGKKAVSLSPSDPAAHYNLALAYDAWKDYQASIEHYEIAANILPDNPSIQFDLGNAYVGWGKIVKARECFRKVTKIEPREVSAYANLARITKYISPDNEDAHRYQKLLKEDWLPDELRIIVLFSLGKIHQDCGLYEEAFDYFRRGNDLQDSIAPFDVKEYEQYITSIVDYYTKEIIRQKSMLGNPSKTPVFIVGTPRSGTTLMEQILSSHPDVFGAGELEWVYQAANALCVFLGSDDSYPRCMDSLTKSKASELSDKYIRYIHTLAGKEKRITDKMPTNFMHLGFIHILFPHAKIIHCRREPKDACISMYCNHFRKGGIAYSHDLYKLGAFYSIYQYLMQHWRTVLPEETMIEVDYEDMVQNQEAESRKVLEFIGMKWDDACLDFYKKNRRVATASDLQVTKPIYSSSVARWKRYEKHLKPLKEGFNYIKEKLVT